MSHTIWGFDFSGSGFSPARRDRGFLILSFFCSSLLTEVYFFKCPRLMLSFSLCFCSHLLLKPSPLILKGVRTHSMHPLVTRTDRCPWDSCSFGSHAQFYASHFLLGISFFYFASSATHLKICGKIYSCTFVF